MHGSKVTRIYLRGGRRLGIEATLASVHRMLNVGRIISASGNALHVETTESSRSIAELQRISYRKGECERNQYALPP